MASFYQGPAWTLPWYRAYASSFDPLVLILEREDQLVGVVPLSVERKSGRLVFAGDVMADYRDVIALPQHREEVIRALLQLYRDRGDERGFRIGPTLPESTTAETVMRICRGEHLQAIHRKHLGWRWLPEMAKERPDPLRKRSVRYGLKHFRRMGPVAADVICSREDWDLLSHTFFEQHSLRQLYGNRPISFDDPQKRQFFRDMFDTPLSHVTVLSVGNRVIAGHYGYLWKDVLYWAAPWFDFREQQYSPGLLLVLLTMQRAEEWGLKAFDLTEGEGYLKERFSTNCVSLSIVELYARPSQYLRRRARDHAVRATRRVLRAFRSESVWPAWTTALSDSAYVLRTAAGMPPRQACRYIAAAVRDFWPARTIALRAPDTGTLTQNPLPPGHEIRTNEIGDLLQGAHDPFLLTHVARMARTLSKARGSDFHSILREGKLLAWGCSRILQESGSDLSNLNIAPHAAVLHDFAALPGEEAALTTLLAHVVTECRRNGAPQIWLIATNLDRATQLAFHSAAFQTTPQGPDPTLTHEVLRSLLWRRSAR
jgi:CelD/BcsL family acetyltransferase involved in cellulose biosynthesis